jgi:uncharacterized protein YqjF (DUF2071 family)
MFNFLKNHPFAVEAYFKRSLVLTYAVPKDLLTGMIPSCLSLDTFEDKWAFVAVALVETKDLRPKGFPKWLGNDFYLIGYRIFVTYIDNRGKRLRGLYILKSATDNKKMELLGGVFTHYNYSTIDINQTYANEICTINSIKGDFQISFDESYPEPALPKGSPFKTWQEARRYAGPLPFTFSCDSIKGTVVIIEGVRSHWLPKPVEILSHNIGFIDQLKIGEIVLANAFTINDIPYFWKKGKIEKWQ